MVTTLERTARDGKAAVLPPVTGAEDFSYFQQKIPGLYFFLGVTPVADTSLRDGPLPRLSPGATIS
jgi:amidohydrolase